MSRPTGLRAARHAQIVAATRRAEQGRVTSSLSVPQARVLNQVKASIDANDVPPSIRELADLLSLAASTVAYHLTELQAKGYLHREAGKARLLRVEPDPEPVPVVSEPAGDPCHACHGTGLAGGETP